jgi:hypothetical protein
MMPGMTVFDLGNGHPAPAGSPGFLRLLGSLGILGSAAGTRRVVRGRRGKEALTMLH